MDRLNDSRYLISGDFAAPGHFVSRVQVGSLAVEYLVLLENPELMKSLVRELRDNVIRTEGGNPTGIEWAETWYRAVIDPETGTAPDDTFRTWDDETT